MQLIHNIIYRVQLAIRAVKATPAFKMQHPGLAIPDYILHQPPSYYPDAIYDYLPLKITQQQCQVHLSDSKPVITGLSHLLLNFRCTHVVDQPGLTWHELFLLALAFTPHPHAVVSSHTAQSAKNIAFLLRGFAVDTVKFVKFALQPQCHKFFLASTSHLNRLLAYGISNKMPHTSLMIQLDDQAYEALNIAMLNISAHCQGHSNSPIPLGHSKSRHGSLLALVLSST